MRQLIWLLTTAYLLSVYECRYQYQQAPAGQFNNAPRPSYGPPPQALPLRGNPPPVSKHYHLHLSNAKQIFEARHVPAQQPKPDLTLTIRNGYVPPPVTQYQQPISPVNQHSHPGNHNGANNYAASYSNTGGYNYNQPQTHNQNPLLPPPAYQQTATAVANAPFNPATSYNVLSAVLTGGANLSPPNAGQQQAYGLGGGGGGGAPYLGQAETGQLDGYGPKQLTPGDARAYPRLITTCYPNGQCEQQQVGAGQVDQRHQHTVASTRARVAPVSDKCRQIAAGQGQLSNQIEGGPYKASLKRPKNRRIDQYRETIIDQDPFN